jgi:fatty-acyl-CoA synthase
VRPTPSTENTLAIFSDHPIRTVQDLRQFETAMLLEQRLPERSVLDVFIGADAAGRLKR